MSVDRQAEVAAWFDRVYRTRGFAYLRPPDAYPIFLQLLEAQPGHRLLDVACGPGLLLEAGCRQGMEVTGVDLSEAAVGLARELVPEAAVHVGNAQALPFGDGRFDRITCIGALERFLDRPAALREIRRVAAADARLCFMVRNARAPGWQLWERLLRRQTHAAHQDAGTLEGWRALFEEAGFAVIAVHGDQWPRQRLRKLLRAGRPHDFARPEPVAPPLLGLRYAYEHIFVLRKG